MGELAVLRKRIDEVDDRILTDLLMRVEICRGIGDLKRKQNKPVYDVQRENAVLKRIREKAELLKLDPERIEQIYREIVNMCITVQQ